MKSMIKYIPNVLKWKTKQYRFNFLRFSIHFFFYKCARFKKTNWRLSFVITLNFVTCWCLWKLNVVFFTWLINSKEKMLRLENEERQRRNIYCHLQYYYSPTCAPTSYLKKNNSFKISIQKCFLTLNYKMVVCNMHSCMAKLKISNLIEVPWPMPLIMHSIWTPVRSQFGNNLWIWSSCFDNTKIKQTQNYISQQIWDDIHVIRYFVSIWSIMEMLSVSNFE